MHKYNITYQVKGTNRTYSKVITAEDELEARSKLTTDVISGNVEEVENVSKLHIIIVKKL